MKKGKWGIIELKIVIKWGGLIMGGTN